MDEKWFLTALALWLSTLLIATGQGTTTPAQTLCAYVHHEAVREMTPKNVDLDDYDTLDGGGASSPVNRNLALQGEILSDNVTIRCPKATDFCYTLWTEDPHNKSRTLLAQGCWEVSGERDCGRTECFARSRMIKALNNTKFCCCAGDYCNNNITDREILPISDQVTTIQPGIDIVEKSNSYETLIISLVTVILVILGISVYIYMRCRRMWKPNPDAVHLVEAHLSPVTPALDLENLKLHEVVGRGRYGTVWHASLNGIDVAVKIFPGQHRQCYLNERDMYSLPFMEHNALLKFLGAEERVSCDGAPQFYLVLSHAPVGCLQDYLRNNVIDWNTLCRMSQTITKGLAHLHTDVRKGDKMKPCISHRDLNSRNVLVRSDLSCVICDLGFAMKIAGSKYYNQCGEEQLAETTSLTDVGTLRYMAPEVLEGAVNLRDCESSLKQIDVYALGLIIWEVATRCSELYQGLEVPEYKLPFEKEIGHHPTFEQMQVLISKNKARPLFPDVWKDTNQAVRLLKETIEDCWDQDAEARLTSLCVDERLQELPILWERHKASLNVSGVSPTVNPTYSQMLTSRQSSYSGTGVGQCTSSDFNFGGEHIHRLNSLGNRETSASETTAETTVTTSPSDSAVPQPQQLVGKNANIQYFPHIPMPLQPYQGRNPCLERNMIMEPLEEVAISGNTLLDKGISRYKGLLSGGISDNNSLAASGRGDVIMTHRHSLGTGGAAMMNGGNNVNGEVMQDVDELFDALHASDTVTESNSLVNHDVLSHSTRVCNPIPYVQNAVHKTGPIPSIPPRPKQPNVPGNGWHHGPNNNNNRNNAESDNTNSKKKWGLKSFFEWTRGYSGGGHKQRGGGNPNNSSSNNNNNNVDGGNENNVVGISNYRVPMNVNLDVVGSAAFPVQTKVCLVGSSGDQVQTVIEQRSLMNGRCKSPTDDDVIPNNIESDNMGRLRRPTSLSLKGHDSGSKVSSASSAANVVGHVYDKADMDMSEWDNINEDDESSSEKIAHRVKTPFTLKTGRFSLYDDRMMSASKCNSASSSPSRKYRHQKQHRHHLYANRPNPCASHSHRHPNATLANAPSTVAATTISKTLNRDNDKYFSHSVPIDIDTLCAEQAEGFLRDFHHRNDCATTSIPHPLPVVASSSSSTSTRIQNNLSEKAPPLMWNNGIPNVTNATRPLPNLQQNNSSNVPNNSNHNYNYCKLNAPSPPIPNPSSPPNNLAAAKKVYQISCL